MLREINTKKSSVPWKGVDVFLFLVLCSTAILISFFIGYLGCFLHPLPPMELRSEQLKLIGTLIIFLALVVVGPFYEEFIFRFLLQGWLEAKCTQHRIPFASGVAIVTTSCVFAVSHGMSIFGIPTQPIYLFGANLVLNLSMIAFGIAYLVAKRNVKMSRCLFGTGRFFRPRFLVGVGYCFLAILLYAALVAIPVLCDIKINKIVTVWFLSLILGTLYSKTQNLSYCVLLHCFVNAPVAGILFFL
jgi:membrane protease YdiL (CAAX protease family)